MIRPILPVLLLIAAPACLVRGPRGGVAVVAPVPVASVHYVDREPPPPRYERMPSAPSGDHVWVEGYWAWEARAYVWVPGRFLLPPRPRAVWVPGRWARHARGWHWTEGRWR
ncbi:MAG: YXWGXW repeat-containing protein [Acidobacteria bacterium]|nr:YXWGXW repeat-containing protein [Acidobacteriota bacterium]